MSRRNEVVTLTPSIAALSAELPAAPAIAEAHPVAQDLTLSRAAIPTVSWLGVSAPEPAIPVLESFSSRGRMLAVPPPAMPPLAPRFSSVPADTMARSHAPSPLPTSDLMRQAFSHEPLSAEQEPQAPADSSNDENTGGSAPRASGQDFEIVQVPNMSSRPLAMHPANEPVTPAAVRDMPPSPGSADAPPSIERRDAPDLALPRMPETPVDDRRMPQEVAPRDETPRRVPERGDAARGDEAMPPPTETVLRGIDLVERVTRSLPRLTRSASRPLARNPFVPASLALLGEQEGVLRLPDASLTQAFALASSGRPDVFSEPPLRVPSGDVSVADSARPAFVTGRQVLPERAAMPVGRDTMPAGRDAVDVRAREMPLPPRDRTAVAASASTLVQRSEAGSSPAGSAPPSTAPAAQPAPAQDAGHTAEPGSGGANEVNLLAGEVWALLRRRLAYEAERMGR